MIAVVEETAADDAHTSDLQTGAAAGFFSLQRFSTLSSKHERNVWAFLCWPLRRLLPGASSWRRAAAAPPPAYLRRSCWLPLAECCPPGAACRSH